MPSASSGPAATAPAATEDAPVEEKPREKTIFAVKLEKFEATAKAKIIREVKAMMPNMNLVEVSHYCFGTRLIIMHLRLVWQPHWRILIPLIGQEVCRVGASGVEGELTEGRSGETTKAIDGSWCHDLAVIVMLLHLTWYDGLQGSD